MKQTSYLAFTPETAWKEVSQRVPFIDPDLYRIVEVEISGVELLDLTDRAQQDLLRITREELIDVDYGHTQVLAASLRESGVAGLVSYSYADQPDGKCVVLFLECIAKKQKSQSPHRQAPARPRLAVTKSSGLIKSVKALRERYGISQEELADYLSSSWPSVSRWERGVSHPLEGTVKRLERLVLLGKEADTIMKPENFKRFLVTANPLLRNKPPIDLLQSEFGFEHLMDFLEGTKSGQMA